MEYQPYSIRKLLDSVKNGAIRIPAFQRGFVWDMDRVSYLMDSIYKGYPFGSLLFWRTKNQLAVERNLGRFELPKPEEEYPIDYVLDGQQRLTSIFTVFQNELIPKEDPNWSDVFFDMDAEDNAQDCQFIALDEQSYDRNRFFPLSVLFDSVKYREATEGLSVEKISTIDKLQEKFKEITIPVQVLKTENRSIVAIVFERINRLGLELDTLQLLAAWTWNEDFDLLEKFRELKDDLAEFGFEGVGDDSDLILDCAAAVLKGEPGAEKLLELNGNEVRSEFSRVQNGIKGAIDFLRTQFKISTLKNLPYPMLLVPLSVFFAEPDGKEVSYNSDTYAKIKRWFWRTCFSARYGSQTRRAVIRDIQEIEKLKHGKDNRLDEIDYNLGISFFTENVFRVTTANTKTFVLVLANNTPKSLVSGKNIDLEKVLQRYNRSEFHHIYPKAFLRDNGTPDNQINSLVNFCFLSSAENKLIGKKRPSDYINIVAESPTRSLVLKSAFCEEARFDDDFLSFSTSRAQMLLEFSNDLMK
ncbi:DUF262 domain-containing protein [Pseudomonas benzopyrenica]|uniref:DUF262 domain-containing protein n=1 Tax=Pseudomonas benzopyrenica TaxID=2993566 RepID=A0ABZ2FMR4_9PSED